MKKLLIAILCLAPFFSPMQTEKREILDQDSPLCVELPSLHNIAGKNEEEIRSICESIIEYQKPAVEATDNLYKLFEMSEDGNWIYADDFCGSYIGDDFMLHILLTNLSKETMTKYQNTIVDHIDSVCFEKANYSINQLETKKNRLLKSVADAKIILFGCGIDMKNNAIVLETSSKYERELKDIVKALNMEDSTKIESLCGAPETTASLRGGDKVVKSGYLPFTLGYCGMYNGQKAVITCGHAFSGTGEGLKLYGALYNFGTSVYRRYPSLGGAANGDFAVVKVTSSDSLTNTIWNNGDYNSIYSVTGVKTNLQQGQMVYRFGITTGYGYGTVLRTGDTVVYSNYGKSTGYQCNGMVKVNNVLNLAQRGDSGGPWFYKNSSISLLCGIQSGVWTYYNWMYFTPYATISAVGFSAKTN